MLKIKSYIEKETQDGKKIYRVGSCVEISTSCKTLNGYIDNINGNILTLNNKKTTHVIKIDSILDINIIHPNKLITLSSKTQLLKILYLNDWSILPKYKFSDSLELLENTEEVETYCEWCLNNINEVEKINTKSKILS